MIDRTNKVEGKRRKLDLIYDSKISEHHIFNLKFSKPYIKNKEVLDIGCWSGQLEMISKKYTKKIVGLDPSKSAINYAKNNVSGARFIQGNALKLPFKNNSFDTILFFDVIEHLPINTENVALSEIHRVLRKNGYLILATPNSHPLSILLDPAYFIIGHRHYSQKYLTDSLKSQNFKIIKTHKSGGLFVLLSMNLETIHKHILKRDFKNPEYVSKKQINEYSDGGFVSNYIVAQKVA